jgi:hypothetical protein
MVKTSEICDDKNERRLAIKAKPELSGIDYIEVDENDRTLLYVHLLDKTPVKITEENILIKGGRRIRNIKVVPDGVAVCSDDDPDHTDCITVRVNKAGDFSTYTLCLVEPDENGQPSEEPLSGFDRRYACAEFSFKANCPSELDCKTEKTCPPTGSARGTTPTEPEIDYLAKDYASFRQLILDRLATIMPDWQEQHIPDIGIMLVELLAYVGDYLSYYQDAVATEAYLETARQRISVRRHVRLVDYPMHEGCNARAWLCLELTNRDTFPLPNDIYFITGLNNILSAQGQVLTDEGVQKLPLGSYEVFEPLLVEPGRQVTLYQAHNTISFYTWGDKECCLPRGATTATLKDEWGVPPSPPATKRAKRGSDEQTRVLHLQVGDVLIFEEVFGPKTGLKEDADPKHRHVVRLTRVEPGVDELYAIPIVEIEWGQEDALPFPLCLSAMGPPEVPPDSVVTQECQLLEDITIARGNVILVDYGKTVDEDLGVVGAEQTALTCEEIGELTEIRIPTPAVFRPILQQAPLTSYEPLPATADPDKPVPLTSAKCLLEQDPHKAVPWIKLTGTLPPDGTTLHELAEEGTRAIQDTDKQIKWTPQSDLLKSQSEDHHFVVETDNDGFAHLRFGDGELGHMPAVGTEFHASYRIGNGRPGNVGAEVISIAVCKGTVSNVTLRPRNPFAATGGVEPEPLAEIKLFAPHAFRSKENIQRAITAEDYAHLAERKDGTCSMPKVQRATAALRWTGSWYEAQVAIDPLGSEETDQALLDEIAANLEPFRRVGHDLKVVSTDYVPLDIEMTICVQPHVLRGHVEAALLGVFSNRILPDGKRGFFHADNLTFGQGISMSKLIAIAQAVPGVQSVKVTRLRRLFDPIKGELKREFLFISPNEIAQLDNDSSFPEHGKLKFKMEGGR